MTDKNNSDWESFRGNYLANKEKMERSRITEVSEVISEIDNLKAALFPRFKHLLQSIAALEARICALEESVKEV